jgi:hypothetical protein
MEEKYLAIPFFHCEIAINKAGFNLRAPRYICIAQNGNNAIERESLISVESLRW